jgi:hypothetical protein
MAAGSARETIMSKPVSRVKKALLGALAIATISTGATAVSVNTAEAQWAPRHRGGYGGGYGYRPNRGAAVAAGIIGGIAAGALIAGATRPAYAAPSYGYGYAPAYAAPSYGYSQPSYYQPAYETYQPAYESYQPTCYFKKVRQVVDYDTVVIRRVRVCQ